MKNVRLESARWDKPLTWYTYAMCIFLAGVVLFPLFPLFFIIALTLAIFGLRKQLKAK